MPASVNKIKNKKIRKPVDKPSEPIHGPTEPIHGLPPQLHAGDNTLAGSYHRDLASGCRETAAYPKDPASGHRIS